MLFAPSLGEVMQGLEAFHQLLAQWRQAIAVAGQEFDEAGLAQLRKPGRIAVGEASSQAVRSAREVSGPSRSSQTMRSVQRRPRRSSRAMTGRPVLEPRTAVFLVSAAGFDIEALLHTATDNVACCYVI